MKILFIVSLLVPLLGVLWMPAWLVARWLSRGGDTLALRRLGVIFPGQLISVVALVFLADALGLRNPAGLVVAIVFGISLLGAGILFLRRVLKDPTR